MRDRKGRRSLVFSLLALSLSGLVCFSAFQNCAPLESDFNPLFDTDLSFDCVGLSCERDLNAVRIDSTVSGVMLDKPTGGSNPNNCDGATCFDLAGYCDTGGYPGSVFYYQWLIGGTTPLNEVRTSSFCDERGRFHVLVRVPFGTFDWNQSHRVRLFMRVIDEEGVEISNPIGKAEFTYVVSIRN